jgi:hypothetical protein
MWEDVGGCGRMWDEERCGRKWRCGRNVTRPVHRVLLPGHYPTGFHSPTIWVHRRGKIRAGDGVGKVNVIRGVVDAWLLVATYIQLPNLGAVSSPGTQEISAFVIYRSPEVHCGKSWDQSTDIWSWGIIVCGPELPLRCSLFSRAPIARATSTCPGQLPFSRNVRLDRGPVP